MEKLSVFLFKTFNGIVQKTNDLADGASEKLSDIVFDVQNSFIKDEEDEVL